MPALLLKAYQRINRTTLPTHNLALNCPACAAINVSRVRQWGSVARRKRDKLVPSFRPFRSRTQTLCRIWEKHPHKITVPVAAIFIYHYLLTHFINPPIPVCGRWSLLWFDLRKYHSPSSLCAFPLAINSFPLRPVPKQIEIPAIGRAGYASKLSFIIFGTNLLEEVSKGTCQQIFYSFCLE